MTIMVFSGSAGTRPDYSFAFKSPINQSNIQSTVYGVIVLIILIASYMVFIVSGTTRFWLNIMNILFSLQGIKDHNFICTPVQLSTGTCDETRPDYSFHFSGCDLWRDS